MTWVSVAALYFVMWWMVLFAVLPVGLKTQDDDENVTLGTVSSAPRGSHVLRAMLWTTLITGILLGAFYGVSNGLGIGFEDIPRVIPDVR